MHYVYVLKCRDRKIYVGCTNNLKDRVKRHKGGCVSYTKSRLPVELKAYFAFDNKYVAYEFEKYLKSGSGRIFIKKRVLV